MSRLLYFLLFLGGTASAENKTVTEFELHKKLFEFYNPDIMPVLNKSEPIEITIDIYVMNIDNIDEKSQTFTIRAFLENRWTDQFLTWKPEDYGGIKRINVRNENIWLPDLALNNVYDSPTKLGQQDGRTIVDFTGRTITWPYKMYQVGCKINIRHFPFDVQVCELDFLSWTNPYSVLKLTTSDKLSLFYYKESAEWSLDSYEIDHYQNPYGEYDSWDHIAFRFTLRRKWLFQVLNMIAPIVCISFLNLTCFLIPSDCGEKITLCISIFLTLAVFLTIITSSLPESSDDTSLFGVYVGLQLLCSGLTILATVISLHLYHKEKTDKVPLMWRALSAMCCFASSPSSNDAVGRHQCCSNGQVTTGEQPYSNGHVFSPEQPKTCGHVTTMEQPYTNGYVPTVEKPSMSKKLKRYFMDNDVSWITVSRAFDRLCLWLSIIWNVLLIVGLVIAFQK